MNDHMKRGHLLTGLLPILLAVWAVGGLLLGAQPASAQSTCIQDVWKAHGNNQKLTCSAQDVTLSEASNINIITGGACVIENGVRVCRCFEGVNVTFTADFRMDLTADTRYDVGFYIATDSDPNNDGALTGQCSATASLASNTPAGNFINLDAAPDVCGDITGPLGTVHNPLFVQTQITTKCEAGPSGQLDLDFCTTWRQPGSNEVCLGTGNGTTTNGVFPGSPSKCNCGILTVPIQPVPPDITLTKTALTASVPETGGDAVYSVTVKNNNVALPFTLTSLTDDKYGDITTTHLANTSCTGSATPGVCQAVTATDCTLATIAAGQTFSCMFTGTVPPGDFPGSFPDVVTGCGTDPAGRSLCDHDDANVPYSDVPQPPTLSKTVTAAACQTDVTYAVVVTNGSAQDTLTLTSLSDDVYGNITSPHGVGGGFQEVVSTTCGQSPGPGTLPAVIAPSGNYSCSFVGRITSCNTTVHDTVAGAATDDDGASYSPSDDATVTVTVGGLPQP
jgi:hypothetical protein